MAKQDCTDKRLERKRIGLSYANFKDAAEAALAPNWRESKSVIHRPRLQVLLEPDSLAYYPRATITYYPNKKELKKLLSEGVIDHVNQTKWSSHNCQLTILRSVSVGGEDVDYGVNVTYSDSWNEKYKMEIALPDMRNTHRVDGFAVDMLDGKDEQENKAEQKRQQEIRRRIGQDALMHFGFEEFHHSPDGSCIAYVCFKEVELSRPSLVSNLEACIEAPGTVINLKKDSEYSITIVQPSKGLYSVTARTLCGSGGAESVAKEVTRVLKGILRVSDSQMFREYYERRASGVGAAVLAGLDKLGSVLSWPLIKFGELVGEAVEKRKIARRAYSSAIVTEIQALGLEPNAEGQSCWVSLTKGCKAEILEKRLTQRTNGGAA